MDCSLALGEEFEAALLPRLSTLASCNFLRRF